MSAAQHEKHTVCVACVHFYLASKLSAQSSDNLNVSQLLQLALTAIGLFTLLAIVIIGVIICRRLSTAVGTMTVYSRCYCVLT